MTILNAGAYGWLDIMANALRKIDSVLQDHEGRIAALETSADQWPSHIAACSLPCLDRPADCRRKDR